MKTTLSTKDGMFFALPSVAVAWLVPPMYAILSDFYLRYTAVTAAGMGTAMLLSKIVDAITDPPVGYFSDCTTTKWGSRKPWIAVGAVLAAITFIFFFNPPEDAGNLYFAIGMIFYYIAFTLIQIPTRSWLGEITQNYSERSTVWSYYTIGLLLGGVLIMALPILLSSSFLPLFDSAEFDQDMVSFGWVGALAILILVAISLKYTPAGVRNLGEKPNYKQFFSIIKSNGPFQIFLTGFTASAIGFGVFYSVIIVALTSYYGFADRIPIFMLSVIFAQVLAIPFIERLARRYSKHTVFASFWVVHVLLAPLMFIFDQNTDYFVSFVILGCMFSIAQGAHMLFPASIMNDIIDYDTLKTGLSRSGNYMALYTFIDKAAHAVGFAIGFYILALFDYNAKATEHSDFEYWGIMMAIAIVPSIFFSICAYYMFKFPIDSHRHGIIRKRIESRTLRAKQASDS